MQKDRRELVFAALVMLAIPLLGEIVLRVVHAEFDGQFYTADADLGWALRSNAQGLLIDETRQFVQINSRGFRDRERSYDKPVNTVRIAVLGNSWTEAMQVPLDKTFTSLLERKLIECSCFGGKRVEVLNF